MRWLKHFAVFVLAVQAIQPAKAEDEHLRALLKSLEELRVDEATGDAFRVVVRASRAKIDGQLETFFIACRLERSGELFLIVQNPTEKTDDRVVVEGTSCDALLAAARAREEAQRRN